jgi:hypothetical protein
MQLLDVNSSINKRQKILSGIALVFIIYTLITYVISLSAFTSPSQSLRWDSVPYINILTYNPGDTVTVTGDLIEGDDWFSRGNYYFFTAGEDIIWIANVKDPNNMPIHLETGSIIDALDDQVIGGFSFTLPSNAVPGTYTLKLLVWTGWLPSGESRTNVIGEINFEVVIP